MPILKIAEPDPDNRILVPAEKNNPHSTFAHHLGLPPQITQQTDAGRRRRLLLWEL